MVGSPGLIELHIDELVLHGFAPGDQAYIRAAVEAELARLFRTEGVPSGLLHAGQVAALDGGTLAATAHAPAETIGAQVAQAVYRGLGSMHRGE